VSADELELHAEAILAAANGGTLPLDATVLRCPQCQDYHAGAGRVCDSCWDEMDRAAAMTRRGWA
jgi:hypothetical protein